MLGPIVGPVIEGTSVGLYEGDWLEKGSKEGDIDVDREADGKLVGCKDGLLVVEENMVGDKVGFMDEVKVCVVGKSVGVSVGSIVGLSVGSVVGSNVGLSVGSALGSIVGISVVGLIDGIAEGPTER